MSRTMFRWAGAASLALLLGGCSGLQKNEALIDAEKAYTEARQDEQVLRYAPTELERADEALRRAATAENMQDMTSLAYIGKTRLDIAKSVAARKAAAARLAELGDIKNQERLRARELEIGLEQQARDEARRAQDQALRDKDNALRDKETALLEREQALADAEELRLELAELQAKKTERGMVMTLGDVLFSTGRTDLLPGARSTIERLAKFLTEYPEKSILVEGHTDNVGSNESNQDLSERRALSVKAALLEAQVDPVRIDTAGMGETTPIADNETSAGRLKNRRVEIVIRD